MINLDALIAAVQSSVIEAANALNARNMELFHSYFETVEDEVPQDVAAAAARVIEASRAAGSAGEPDAAQDAIRRAGEALERAVEALASKRKAAPALRPKTTAIQYPHITKDGPTVHTVHVPLIALAPICFAQITELRMKTDLELSVQGDSLTASFPAEPRTAAEEAAGKRPAGRTASVEIVLGEMPSSQGLRLIVEGYERALRAQIPG